MRNEILVCRIFNQTVNSSHALDFVDVVVLESNGVSIIIFTILNGIVVDNFCGFILMQKQRMDGLVNPFDAETVHGWASVDQ
jgi:hypothetical protein